MRRGPWTAGRLAIIDRDVCSLFTPREELLLCDTEETTKRSVRPWMPQVLPLQDTERMLSSGGRQYACFSSSFPGRFPEPIDTVGSLLTETVRVVFLEMCTTNLVFLEACTTNLVFLEE